MQLAHFPSAMNQESYDTLKRKYRHAPLDRSILNLLAATTAQYLESIVTVEGVSSQYRLLRKIREDIDSCNDFISKVKNRIIKTDPETAQQTIDLLVLLINIDDRINAVLDMYEARKSEIDPVISTRSLS